MPKKYKSKTELGDDFEKYIRSLYEALGFKVERNVTIKGQQVDMLAQRSLAGLGQIKIAIECKYLTSGSVSNQAVHEFCSFIKSAREGAELVSGVIVTNRDFSRDAKDAAIEPFVKLKRQADLEHDLFDVTDVLVQKVNSYEQTDLFQHYVPLSGQGRLPNHKRTVQFDDVLTTLEMWLSDNPTGLITILGDFGSGKTTLLHRLEYQLRGLEFTALTKLISRSFSCSGTDNTMTHLMNSSRQLYFDNLIEKFLFRHSTNSSQKEDW